MFLPGTTTAGATLTGLADPDALAFDTSGNLYVANAGNNTVSVFSSGATTASATLTGLSTPDSLAFDASGNLYVANSGGTTVSVFAPGATTATATLTGLTAPDALALDSNGNLYVADLSAGVVSKFSTTASTAVATTVVIRSSVESLAMQIGASGSVAGIDLTVAELSQILITNSGGVTFGDSQQTGDIDVSLAANTSVNMSPGMATISGGSAPFHLTTLESSTVIVRDNAASTSSEVTLLGLSTGSNTFIGTSAYAFLEGTGYTNLEYGFKTVIGRFPVEQRRGLSERSGDRQ